jgi:hypothetical protein
LFPNQAIKTIFTVRTPIFALQRRYSFPTGHLSNPLIFPPVLLIQPIPNSPPPTQLQQWLAQDTAVTLSSMRPLFRPKTATTPGSPSWLWLRTRRVAGGLTPHTSVSISRCRSLQLVALEQDSTCESSSHVFRTTSVD